MACPLPPPHARPFCAAPHSHTLAPHRCCNCEDLHNCSSGGVQGYVNVARHKKGVHEEEAEDMPSAETPNPPPLALPSPLPRWAVSVSVCVPLPLSNPLTSSPRPHTSDKAYDVHD